MVFLRSASGGASMVKKNVKEVIEMPQGNGTGPPQGRGGGGRMGGPFAAGPDGECVCPKCGHKVSHVRGQPCNQITCPKCGTTMTRS